MNARVCGLMAYLILCPPHPSTPISQGMEDCVAAGLARNIGISNFNSQQIQRVLDAATIKPCSLQVSVWRNIA